MIIPFVVFIRMEILNEALKQGFLPSIVVAIYLIIIKLIDGHQEKTTIKLTDDFINASIRMGKFIEEVTDDMMQKNNDKTQIAIRNIFKSSANSIIKFATNIIINNHIESNKTAIIDNIESFINSEYYTLYNNLLCYNTSRTKLTNYIKEDWKLVIIESIINIIYNPDMTNEQKLYNINNRINIKLEDYCIYVSNKFIEYDKH